ncbi:unnamed protein product [Caenorhabditis auriculariae]|uniref:Uncharacterized protein n=1 Tax=Caenorhabditis auriculariae TaxID=2777116 RepID=A0A8S1HIC1_9PELO|nr:unnamed protein product [Caenorhabditis auriculariae]
MGLFSSKPWNYFFRDLECRALILGLDGAGKTTILYQLRLKKFIAATPTIGFNVETVNHKNISMSVWDIGREHLRTLRKHYFPSTDAMIFVVDSSERLNEAREELWDLLRDPDLQKPVLLVLANKQDLPRAMETCQVTEALELDKIEGREWNVIGTNGLTGDGRNKGLEWLSEKLNQKK